MFIAKHYTSSNIKIKDKQYNNRYHFSLTKGMLKLIMRRCLRLIGMVFHLTVKLWRIQDLSQARCVAQSEIFLLAVGFN